MEPLELMVVLRPLLLMMRTSGSVMPEKYGRLTLPRRVLGGGGGGGAGGGGGGVVGGRGVCWRGGGVVVPD